MEALKILTTVEKLQKCIYCQRYMTNDEVYYREYIDTFEECICKDCYIDIFGKDNN